MDDYEVLEPVFIVGDRVINSATGETGSVVSVVKNLAIELDHYTYDTKGYEFYFKEWERYE